MFRIRNVIVACCGCAMAATPLAAQLAQRDPAAVPNQQVPAVNGTPQVFSLPFGPQDPVFGPGADSAVMPDHPPFDEIPWMPMPESGPLMPTMSDTVTFHDAETGLTVELPLSQVLGPQAGAQRGYVGADGLVSPEPMELDGFGTMSTISGSNLLNFPWRANAKMIMRFVDQNNNTRWFVCSCAMQDAGVVLTAAHCVYARSPNGINIFDWAREVWIYPGWDGVGTGGSPGPSSSEIINEWGWTRGTSYIAGSDWVNNGNFDRDMAVVRITRGTNRSVGMLTGWFGYAWGGDCGPIQGLTYHNASFPAENCSATLHTGRQMYYWFGGFDSCPGNQLQINTTAGCLTALWGGQSGSNAYYIDGSDRFAHAVASNSNRTTSGRYTKMWTQFKDDMNTFRTTTRGTTFDLEAFRYRLSGSTTIQAGTATSTSSFTAANSTNATQPARTFTYRVYLSTNNAINSSDTLIGTFTFNWTYAAMQNVNVNVPAVTIPASTAPGTYWLGVVLDPATDAFSANNHTSTWDAQRITVTAAAPGNNTCGSAGAVFDGGVYNGSTSTATASGYTATCGFGATTTPDVWYSFTAPCTGTLQLDTCGSSFDTVLSVRTGCPGDELACNDDSAFCSNALHSMLTVPVIQGTNYRIRVSGYNGATGNFTLRVNMLAPSNDNCASAIAIGPGTRSFSTCGATTDGPNEPTSCSFFGYTHIDNDIWYRYTANCTGVATVNLCGSSYDTKVAVYGGTCANLGAPLACNDDWCGLQSQLTFNATAGQQYLIRIGGYQGRRGAGVMDISCAPTGTELLPIPPFNNTFSSAALTRGFWFQAPTSFVISGLRVPDESGHGLQNVQVFRLTAPPPIFPTTTNNLVSLGRFIAQPSANVIPTSISVQSGQYIGILGACGDALMMHNSYSGENTFVTDIAGHPATLKVAGMQFNLVTTQAGNIWTHDTSPMSRVEVYYSELSCYANCDGSTTPPILNVEDFSCFINKFAEAQALPHFEQLTHYANCDNSTTAPVLNVEDFSCFINKFAQGCP
jgi:hypothetical protein